MALEGIRGIASTTSSTTTGSQQALDLVAKLFIDPGDVDPRRVAELRRRRSACSGRTRRASCTSPWTSDGLIPEALRETIAHLRGQGRRIKFLYTIPNFHNPAGVTLVGERRRRDPRDLPRERDPRARGQPLRPAATSTSRPRTRCARSTRTASIYLGSFSKTLAPGFRVGWALAPHAIREKLILAAESAILSPSSFSQLVVSEYLSTTDWRAQIDTFRGVYRERKDAMIEALGEYLPAAAAGRTRTAASTSGSRMPDVLDSKQMLPRAVKELVAYTPGTAFFADGRGRHAMRLSFCYPTPEAIRVGIRRLATVVNGELDLLDTFAGTGTLQLPPSADYDSAPPSDLK